MNKTFSCPICKRNYMAKHAVYDHMEREHEEQLYGLPAAQIYFNLRNRYFPNKEFGKCVMSGKPTKFNLVTERYERFASEEERKKYREYFRQNMIKTYGKDTLLDEPDHQKKMLASRSISGIYKWQNGHETLYTGSYERNFLEYLEVELGWDNPEDVMAPAPMSFHFKDEEGKSRFHIPDFYITSLNLIVNIKSSDNEHYRLRDIDREKLQDQAIKKSKFNYLKIYDNDFSKLVDVIQELNSQDKPKRIFVNKP